MPLCFSRKVGLWARAAPFCTACCASARKSSASWNWRKAERRFRQQSWTVPVQLSAPLRSRPGRAMAGRAGWPGSERKAPMRPLANHARRRRTECAPTLNASPIPETAQPASVSSARAGSASPRADDPANRQRRDLFRVRHQGGPARHAKPPPPRPQAGHLPPVAQASEICLARTRRQLKANRVAPESALAPGVGLEPTTERLTVACSTS